MKRCPKCSRTYPDDNQKFCTVDGGLLLSAEQAFDPNATVQIPSPRLESTPQQPPRNTSGIEDLNATVALPSSPKTGNIPQPTSSAAPAGAGQTPTTPAPSVIPPTTALPPRPQSPPSVAVAPPAKKSKLPLILGILLLLLVLGVAAIVAIFFLVIKPRLNAMQTDRPVVVQRSENANVNQNESVNSNTSEPLSETEYVAPPDTVKFTNSQANLDGKLADHYFDFSFYYPNTWNSDPKAGVPGASNFAKVERRLPPDFTQENFAVGWYTSGGTFAADEPTFPQLVTLLGSTLSSGFPEYRKVSEGPPKINSLDAYEFRFVAVSRGTEKGDIQLWGRVVFLPPGVSGEQTGATLIMLATSLAPELTSVDDVGTKGEMPVILDSFRFGRK